MRDHPLEEDADRMDYSRLSMPLGEAIFTQRSIHRFRPDLIPLADIRLILEAAVRAPNGGNLQVARFLVVSDRAAIRGFGELYHEAWWAKRRDEGFERRDDLPTRFPSGRAGRGDGRGALHRVCLGVPPWSSRLRDPGRAEPDLPVTEVLSGVGSC
jgi:nitroreductase